MLHAFFLGHPVVKHHTGDGITNSITECVKIYDINRSQYLGGSFDGAYFHLGIPGKLDRETTRSIMTGSHLTKLYYRTPI